MVMTHKLKSTQAEKQKKEVVFKRESPNRIFMSKAQVLRENAINRTKAVKFDEVKAKIESEIEVEAIESEIAALKKRKESSKDEVVQKDLTNQIAGLEVELQKSKDRPKDDNSPEVSENSPTESTDNLEVTAIKSEIDKLADKYKSLKGPGSKAKKEEIGEQIRVLEAKLLV